jgi:hypothetical protein
MRAILGKPYVDLSAHIELADLERIDDEICLALTQVDVGYTGGSHKWMGIVPPSLRNEPYIDYGETISRMSRAEFARLVALSDTPGEFDLEKQGEYEFGEERDWPLNHRQMRYLEYRYGVYFPWKIYYEMMPNLRWEDRAQAAGKDFTAEAKLLFPRTLALVEKLPFRQIGRCNILGLAANDHGTVHRDGDPDDPTPPGHFITLCPRGNKRLFLWNEEKREKTPISGHAYWFDDRNYHGVEPDPFFRYSLRVDGIFEPDFLAELSRG